MHIYKKIFLILTPHERYKACLLLFLITITSFLEMLGVASILPFMTVLTNPEAVNSNYTLNFLFEASQLFGFESNKQFIFFLGIIFFILLVISLIFKSLTIYAQVRFIQMREYSIGHRLIKLYLSQPYIWFLNQNTANISKSILSETQQIITLGLRPIVELISRIILSVLLITLLILINPKIALIISTVFGVAYVLIFALFKNYLSQIGKKRLENNQVRFTTINEAFGAIKEIKAGGLENYFLKKFTTSSKIYASTLSYSKVLAQIPRFIVEAISFGGILLLIIFTINKTGSFNSTLPIITLYVFAGYRLLPAFQVIYSSLSQITFVKASIDKLSEDFKKFKNNKKSQNQIIIPFEQKINLKNIYYSYPDTSKHALRGLSLDILSKSTIGIIGKTGSGKTTLVDIILCLLQPEKGTLEVDGKIITKKNVASWQRNIGYVPQNIYLTDNTILSNIAIGQNVEDINFETVKKVSKIANLYDFINNDLPDRFQTIVGERGVRLSGGQRQRIGIARALYNNPKLLILDEATSALDRSTEMAITDAISNLKGNTTTIIIAHRLSSLKHCEKIFKLDEGQIAGHYNYEDIINEI